MHLFHHPLSAPSRFVRLVLGEYQVEFELAVEHVWQRRPEFLAVNPANTVPVLIAEAGVAIVGAGPASEFLDETRGVMMRQHRLMPDYPLERAEVRRLIDWFTGRLDADACRPLVNERVIKIEREAAGGGGGAPDSTAMRMARNNARQHLKYLNWLAGTRNWLAGPSPSLADLSAGASLSVLDYLGEVPWADLPQAKEWYARVKSRPAFRPLLADRIRGVAPASHYADLDF